MVEIRIDFYPIDSFSPVHIWSEVPPGYHKYKSLSKETPPVGVVMVQSCYNMMTRLVDLDSFTSLFKLNLN